MGQCTVCYISIIHYYLRYIEDKRLSCDFQFMSSVPYGSTYLAYDVADCRGINVFVWSLMFSYCVRYMVLSRFFIS